MNKLWNTNNYSPEKINRTDDRHGLRLKMDPRVHPFIRRELRIFCRWLRSCYSFPVRIHVYIPNARRILSRSNELCFGTCFIPEDPNDTVSIDVAGGFQDTSNLQALQNFTWATIFTLAHELGHYFQYINQVTQTPRGAEWQATYYAHQIQIEYYTAEWDHMDDGWDTDEKFDS